METKKQKDQTTNATAQHHLDLVLLLCQGEKYIFSSTG